MPYCQTCGSMIDEYDSGYYARNMLCIPCYSRKASEVEYVSCARCGTRIRRYEAREGGGRRLCNYCYNEVSRVEKLPTCAVCKKKIEAWQKTERLSETKIAHADCVREKKEETRKILAAEEKRSDREAKGGGTMLGAVMNKIVSILP